MRRVPAYRHLASALALLVVLFSCAKENSQPHASVSPTLIAAPPLPAFTGVVGQFDAGANFVAFLEKNADREVQLNITIPDTEFDGSAEDDNSFFVIFDDCGDQAEDEKPVAGPCTGTEINVVNPDGPTLLSHGKGAWKLTGRFQVGEETGPLEGLMSVALERKLRP
jgi:hypothetical protein